MTKSIAISGFVKSGFEAVREAFIENFERRHELRGRLAMYRSISEANPVLLGKKGGVSLG